MPEKEEVYDVFYRFGARMKLKAFSANYSIWVIQKEHDMENDLEKSKYTLDFFRQYKKHPGPIRYFVLIEGQKLIIPEKFSQLLGFSKISMLTFIIPFYKLSRHIKLDVAIKKLLLPKKHEKEIKEIDMK